MHLKHPYLLSGLAALVVFMIFVSVLERGHEYEDTRWANFLVGDPHTGSQIFQQKGCAHCHSVNGVGGKLAPDLGFQEPPQSGMNQIVTAMWNHAPRMWQRMREEKVSYPQLSYQDIAHLFAYLYTARYVDEPGNESKGEQLFAKKGCIQCHAIHGQGGTVGPDLSSFSDKETPIAWTQAMWDHAPAMQDEAAKRGIAWPKFEGSEMNDMLAYIRSVAGGPRREFELLPADPDRGMQLFQSKSCVVCHAIKGEGGHVGPELGPTQAKPLTIVQFAGSMWNHSPEMWREMKTRNVKRPTFAGREMADLIAYLNSLRYFEAGGSPRVGEMLFVRRGCSNCHGLHGEGTASAPAVRTGGGRTLTSVTLAGELWRHGPTMYERAQQLKLPWPQLSESDIGDLVVFLNTPPGQKKPPAKDTSTRE